jgi:hypothetical protein
MGMRACEPTSCRRAECVCSSKRKPAPCGCASMAESSESHHAFSRPFNHYTRMPTATPSFESRQYWDSRFTRCPQSFDWLVSPAVLIPPLLAALSHDTPLSSPTPSILHIRLRNVKSVQHPSSACSAIYYHQCRLLAQSYRAWHPA